MSHSSVYYADLTRDQKVQKLSETDLAPKSCRARSDGKICVLDSQHKALGTAHLHRTPSGEIIAFRLEEKVCADQPHEKAPKVAPTASVCIGEKQ